MIEGFGCSCQGFDGNYLVVVVVQRFCRVCGNGLCVVKIVYDFFLIDIVLRLFGMGVEVDSVILCRQVSMLFFGVFGLMLVVMVRMFVGFVLLSVLSCWCFFVGRVVMCVWMCGLIFWWMSGILMVWLVRMNVGWWMMVIFMWVFFLMFRWNWSVGCVWRGFLFCCVFVGLILCMVWNVWLNVLVELYLWCMVMLSRFFVLDVSFVLVSVI